MTYDPRYSMTPLQILRDAGHQIGDADMLQTQNRYVMRICVDGVSCTLEGVLKMAEEERKER